MALNREPVASQISALSFLTAILPSCGAYCLAHRKGLDGPWIHSWHNTIEELAEAANTRREDGCDVWFAVSSFSNNKRRFQSEVRAIKVLILDLDVGQSNPEKYSSIEDAELALVAFEKKFLQAAFVVRSGFGLHVYWIFEQELTGQDWASLASRFKSYCKQLGLKADPKRTADSASVLRVPGTQNYKDVSNPRPVFIMRQGEQVLVAQIEARLPVSVLDSAPVESSKALVSLAIENQPAYRWFDELSVDQKLIELDRMLAVLGVEIQNDKEQWPQVMAAISCAPGIHRDVLFQKFEQWSTQQETWQKDWYGTDPERNRDAIRGWFDRCNRSNVGALINKATAKGYKRPNFPAEAISGEVFDLAHRFSAESDAGVYLRDNFLFVESEGGYRRKYGRDRLSPETFNRINAARMPLFKGRAMSADFIAMGLGYVECVQGVACAPGEDAVIEYRRKKFSNTWSPWMPSPVKPALEFMQAFKLLIGHLAQGDADTPKMIRYILDSIAFLVQNPKKRLQKVLVLSGEIQGSGKTILMLQIPRLLFGIDNVGWVGENEVSSNFNTWAGEYRIRCFEELWMGSRRDAEKRTNELKATISDDRVRIHAKGKDGYDVKNVTSIFATSNYPDAVHVSTTDRRYAIARTTAPALTPEQAQQIAEQLKHPDAAGILSYIFQKRDISKFDPYAAPPVSQAKLRAMDYSRDDALAAILEAWEEERGPFAKDIVTQEEVLRYVQSYLGRTITRKAITRALQENPIKGSDVVTSKWDDGKSKSKRGWIVRNHQIWLKEKSSGEQYDELMRII